MSSVYAGNPALFPADYLIPDDAEPPTASAFNTASEALGDRTAWLKERLSAIEAPPVAFTSTTAVTWTAGTYDTLIELDGYGGGSGGGGGASGDTFADDFTKNRASGGGGGGAAIRHRVILSVTPGTVYEIVCGAGGNGGTGGVYSAGITYGGNGFVGGDTIFRVQGGATLATFKGAGVGGKGGEAGFTSAGVTINRPIVAGGAPTNQYRPTGIKVETSQDHFTLCHGPGFGGDGTASLGAIGAGVSSDRKGADSIDGYSGGASGVCGATVGIYIGGGAGGGGAAGPGGPGLPGKNGGDGASSGVGGDAPVLGVGGYGPNSGAGGGGGGGGGGGPGGGGAGSNGFAGDSGYLSLRVIG